MNCPNPHELARLRGLKPGETMLIVRPVVPQPEAFGDKWHWRLPGANTWLLRSATTAELLEALLEFCPHELGDVLVVQEPWRTVWLDRADAGGGGRYGDVPFCKSSFLECNEPEDAPEWYPAATMPSEAAYYRLTITAVDCKPVREITDAEALASGIITDADYGYDPDARLCPCPDCDGLQVHGALGEHLGVIEVDCSTCDTPKKRFKIHWHATYPDADWDKDFAWLYSVSVTKEEE